MATCVRRFTAASPTIFIPRAAEALDGSGLQRARPADPRRSLQRLTSTSKFGGNLHHDMTGERISSSFTEHYSHPNLPRSSAISFDYLADL